MSDYAMVYGAVSIEGLSAATHGNPVIEAQRHREHTCKAKRASVYRSTRYYETAMCMENPSVVDCSVCLEDELKEQKLRQRRAVEAKAEQQRLVAEAIKLLNELYGRKPKRWWKR
jgi:hypothetical protein